MILLMERCIILPLCPSWLSQGSSSVSQQQVDVSEKYTEETKRESPLCRRIFGRTENYMFLFLLTWKSSSWKAVLRASGMKITQLQTKKWDWSWAELINTLKIAITLMRMCSIKGVTTNPQCTVPHACQVFDCLTAYFLKPDQHLHPDFQQVQKNLLPCLQRHNILLSTHTDSTKNKNKEKNL